MEQEHQLTNRQKSQQATKPKFWCGGCDDGMAGQFGKCSNCGWSNGSNKKKKVK